MNNDQSEPQDPCGGDFTADGVLDCGWGELTQKQLVDDVSFRIKVISFYAYQGHEPSRQLLSKVLEMIRPPTLEHILITVPPSVARAMQVRAYMSFLSECVKPSGSNKSGSTLHGPVEIDPSAAQHDLYPLAVRHQKKGMTLKSLAVRAVIEILQRRGYETIDERVIARDLSYCSRWEVEHPDLMNVYLYVRGAEEALPFVPCAMP